LDSQWGSLVGCDTKQKVRKSGKQNVFYKSAKSLSKDQTDCQTVEALGVWDEDKAAAAAAATPQARSEQWM